MESLRKVSETVIVRTILERLHLLDGVFWRSNNVGVYSEAKKKFLKPQGVLSRKGISDILGCFQGKAVAIEVKTPPAYRVAQKVYNNYLKFGRTYAAKSRNEQHMLNQVIFIEDIIQNGGIAFFTYSAEHALIKLHSDRANWVQV